MKDQFINNKIIGIIYKNLISKLNLQLNTEDKTKLTKKMIKVMTEIYNNIEIKRVTPTNFKNILRQFINSCYQIIYNDLNKDTRSSNREAFSPSNQMDRDRQIAGNPKNIIESRPENSKMAYAKDDRFASFNDSFNINPRQQGGFQGRYDKDNAPLGKKSDFNHTLDERYNNLQSEYRTTFNNERPSTPPELKGDGGANLNKMAKDNLRNKQEAQGNRQSNSQSNKQINTQDFFKQQDPRAKPNNSGGGNISQDTFNFGAANDVDKNYDTLDAVNNFEGNMNQWNTGINPDSFKIDENTPLEQRLKQYQSERENITKKPSEQVVNSNQNNQSNESNRKQVRFNEEQFNQGSQEQRIQLQQSQQSQKSQQYVQQQSQQYRSRERDDQDYDPPQRAQSNSGYANDYEETIELLLEKVKNLQQQQLKHINGGGGTDTDGKIKLLENKKNEILGEVSKLQSLTIDLERQEQMIQEKEHQVRLKELDIEQKIKRYANIRNIDEKQIMIKANAGRFTYTLQDACQNVSCIQLLNYNIPYEEHNINDNNNKLYFAVISENNANIREDSDNDIISSDSENNVDEIYINSNKLNVMKIPENNYDIYGLLEIMNKIGNKWDIHFSLIKSKIIIKTAKHNRLKLYLDREYQNNILPYLGFNRIIGDKNRHVAEKKYNIKNDKMVQLYVKNISSDPIGEFLIGSAKVHRFSKDVNIENLTRLDIEIKINEKLFVPQEPYVLEFNLLLNNAANSFVVENKKDRESLREKDREKERELENEREEEVNTDDNDLLSKVTSMMGI